MANPFARWKPELRRAVMRARPEYFDWTAEERERYAVAIPKGDRARLEQSLLADLFGRTTRSRAEAEALADRLTLDEQHRVNEVVLPLVGIGEDSFYLNTFLAKGKTLLDFETVRDYDEDDYRFQERSRKKNDANYAGQPYRGSLYMVWARFFVGEQFTYGTLSMAAGYLYSQVSTAASDLLQACIPHRYVRGPRDGKSEGEFWELDSRIDASGQEAMLEELQDRVWQYELARWEALKADWDAADRRGVYLIDRRTDEDVNLDVVSADKDALGSVRFRSFLRDCRASERPAEELHHAIAEETARLAAFVAAQHGDLKQNFDPAITRLRPRKRLMIHQNALGWMASAED